MGDASTDDALRGAAFHEAGHIVVAWTFGRKASAAAIQSDGGGSANDLDDPNLPRVQRVAIAFAGSMAQRIFNAPTNANASFYDHVAVQQLLADLGEDESLRRRDEGRALATAILTEKKDALDRVAGALMRHLKLGRQELADLLCRD
jgi:Peptidase M50B-like